MRPFAILTGLLLSAFALGWPATVFGQVASPTVVDFPSHETEVVEESCQVLKEIMEIPAKGIPVALLADARGIVLIPNLLKGGFLVGVRRGHGVMIVRDEKNAWKPPVFVTVTGGSVGWQIGIQATDLILVFKTQKSIQRLLEGKFTIGADAAVAAGPVGREAAAATDAFLNAEIFCYSRSRGLFAGISLDGSAIQIDSAANAQYYRLVATPPGLAQEVPPSAQKLLGTVAQYTSAETTPTPAIAPFPQN
jgi:lipid-binding SYLF domain-containing protein